MALPRHVQKQIDDVEALEKQLRGEEGESPKLEENEAKLVEGEEPAVEQQEEPKAEQDDDKTSEPVKETKAEKEPKKPDNKDELEYWKQKYRTLQGMYDKDVPVLHNEVRQLKLELEAAKKPVDEPKQSKKSLVTDDDVQTFGEDLIEVQRKVAREVAGEFEDKIQALREENENLRKMVNTTDSNFKQSSFQSELNRLVPDFAEVDNDPAWIGWLDEYDPVLRGPRRRVAEQAFQSGDAAGVAHYVNMFRETIKSVEAPKNDNQKELERQIQPSKTAQAATPSSKAAKTYSQPEIDRMFKKVTSLNSSGRLDEARKLEAEIDAAYMDGRVSA